MFFESIASSSFDFAALLPPTGLEHGDDLIVQDVPFKQLAKQHFRDFFDTFSSFINSSSDIK